MENNLPLGKPKYNQDLNCFNLDCSEDIQISCNETDCRLIDIKKNGALILTLLAASVLICVKNDESDCSPCLVKDYRQANNSAPYVNLMGYSSECENKFFKVENLSIYPKKGQDIQALKAEVIAAICACISPSPLLINLDNGISFNEDAGAYGLGGELNRQTLIVGNSQNFGFQNVNLFQIVALADILIASETEGVISANDKVQIECAIFELNEIAFTYYGNPSIDGSWRMGRIGNDFVHQRLESSVWVTKQTISA